MVHRAEVDPSTRRIICTPTKENPEKPVCQVRDVREVAMAAKRTMRSVADRFTVSFVATINQVSCGRQWRFTDSSAQSTCAIALKCRKPAID